MCGCVGGFEREVSRDEADTDDDDDDDDDDDAYERGKEHRTASPQHCRTLQPENAPNVSNAINSPFQRSSKP